ncbi:hypothetical protein B4N89_43280 [Embleya scabrispora]|uniref:Uncharacterized protein n=1 Tax=Embleya scabrispora TaxID=159449 RepID=A0A1T3NL07_9ACTN|nr:hypothetical protein [Embleya scabrispora]OPC77345.1 hypothetical protein B4N89_43280 [Embleya scabrispora]
MEIHRAHGHVTLPDRDDVEVTLDLYDWPVDGDTLPRRWTAVIDGTPALETGIEGVLHLDTEPTALGHRFLVVAGGDHVTRIIGHDPT